MIAALRAWRRGWQHLNHRGYLYIWANVLWVLLSLPLITAPAAWAGLNRLSYALHRSPGATLDEFWMGFRENLKRGAVLALVNIVVVVVNATNLVTYRGASGGLTDLIKGVWLVTLVVWFGTQFFVWALFYQMEQPSLVGAFRNTAAFILLNPVFTLVSWVLVVVVVAISVLLFPAVMLLTGSALAAIATTLVIDRIQAAGYSGGIPPEVEGAGEDGYPSLDAEVESGCPP